ncbi:MAG: aconitate hydratase, partial [Clostridia bacterium]|nr:aconitate hydratase [Clostridia bacterium]
LLKGKTVAPGVSLSISPGSRQVLSMLIETGALNDMVAAGARILECACGPCIGMGFSPNSGGVSVRTFNRNFEGRSGTADAKVYLASPETAVACALTGKITDPTTLGEAPIVAMPESFRVDDRGVLLLAAPEEAAEVEIERGPNIGKCPVGSALENEMTAQVVLKVGDDITTDHIMPAGAKILPYRSNIPFLSKFCFGAVDPDFAERAKATQNGVIVGGQNYGQGSSREHAALVPLYLGVRAVITKSFSRIHRANLINAGILPLTLADPADYDKLTLGEGLTLSDLHEGIDEGKLTLITEKGEEIALVADYSERQKKILLAGGLLPYTRDN